MIDRASTPPTSSNVSPFGSVPSHPSSRSAPLSPARSSSVQREREERLARNMMPVDLSYGEDASVKMAESASLLPGNLAVLQGLEEGGVAYGLVSRHVAAVTYASSTGAIESESVSFPGAQEDASSRILTGMEWCRLKSSRVVLVLTSYRGFRISSWNGSEVVYENLFETRKGSYERRFAKGVASVDNILCVGTSEGNITVLYVPPTGHDVVFTRHLQGHSAPITALCPCSLNQVASSDESGMIIVWSNPVISAESRLVINEPGSFPCLCLCYWREVLAAGYSSGTIRLYNIESGRKTVEISAHGRSVTALDIAQDSGLLLSVSEDCTASVWRLTTEEETHTTVTHLCCLNVVDHLLCGGKFCDPLGDSLALTAFDSRTILTYRRQSHQQLQTTDHPQT